MTKIDVMGTALAYDDTGDPSRAGATGTPVVLLHAGIADRRMWRHQVAALAHRHRVLAPDLPGYGQSALPAGPFAHHDDVVGLIDALGIEQAALVGCSFGGAVAIDAALAHPDRISALALFDTAVSGHRLSDEAKALWESTIGEVDEDDLDAVAAAEVRFFVVGPGRQPAQVDPALLRFAEEMDRHALAAEQALAAVPTSELDPPALGRLGELRVPVLVGVGAYDVPDFKRLADRVAAAVPGAVRLPDIPNAAHLAPLEQPGPVNAALLDFLT
ncbi:MAG TPA: alpha/beta hydrolase [Micromonosporaceae bacterium]